MASKLQIQHTPARNVKLTGMCYEYKDSSRTKRLDLLHKLSAEVVRKNQVIILEDWRI